MMKEVKDRSELIQLRLCLTTYAISITIKSRGSGITTSKFMPVTSTQSKSGGKQRKSIPV